MPQSLHLALMAGVAALLFVERQAPARPASWLLGPLGDFGSQGGNAVASRLRIAAKQAALAAKPLDAFSLHGLTPGAIEP
jgi:hypothetical protein